MALRLLELSLRAPEAKREEAMDRLEKVRSDFYNSVTQAWTQADQTALISLSQCSRALALQARILTESIYPYCGMIAANPATEINRVFRNMNTASQHPLLL